MLNEGTTFGTKLMTEDELAVLKAKQTAAAAAKLMNTNPAEEEPMSPPEGFVDQNIAPLEIPITEKEMNAMINESDNTVDSSPISTIEEEVSPLEVPVENEPVAVSKEEAPQQITPPSDLYEDPATKEEVTKEQKTILRSLSELRRPDNNMNDTILGYTKDNIEVRSRASYNPSLIRVHRRFWGASDKKNPTPYITIPARAKVKRNGDTIPFIWDEGGCENDGKGFAVAVMSQEGKMVEPIMVVVPETDYQYYDNTIFCNWHHSKMPLTVGDFVLTASRTPQGDHLIAMYQIDNVLIEDVINPSQKNCKATLEANLAYWMTQKNGSMDVHTIRDTPFNNNLDHPALAALIKQINEPNSTRPTWCKKFIPTFNFDFRTYLNDSKFEPMSELYTDNLKLLDDLDKCTSDLCFDLTGHQQVRIYRVAKFFPKTHDITVFYYVVKYDTDKRSYDDSGRIKYAQITFLPNDSIMLFGDESGKMYSFEELLGDIQNTTYNNQSITEFRRVTP